MASSPKIWRDGREFGGVPENLAGCPKIWRVPTVLAVFPKIWRVPAHLVVFPKIWRVLTFSAGYHQSQILKITDYRDRIVADFSGDTLPKIRK